MGLAFLRAEMRAASLILLDLKMPGMDGLDVLREIRSDERLRPIPVIIVTHSDLESDKAAPIKTGRTVF